MTGRGGRDRVHRDYPQERSQSSRSNAPPSRHLWVGNLSQTINETTLSSQFLRFGELETVAFQPGRSYAFINFQREEDAIAAMRGLQSFPVAGMPLKIEFAKVDKSSILSYDDYLQSWDEPSTERGFRLLQKDARPHYAGLEKLHSDKPKTGDKNAEPSEVLWIGFPALLKVDEMILRKAFSPFGEIEKITAFSGRNYAFVQFRSIISACKAKETLQGKLFGNPRVHICFANSERGTSISGRSSMNVPPSSNVKPITRPGFSDNFWEDRNFGHFPENFSIRSPCNSNLGSGSSNYSTLSREDNLWTGGDSAVWERRFQEPGSEVGLSKDILLHRHSVTGDRGVHFFDFSSQECQTKSSLYEESWDLPDDSYHPRGAKKLKTGFYPPERELPDYPFPDVEKERPTFSKMFSDRRSEDLQQRLESVSVSYKQVPDHPVNLLAAHGERNIHWKESLDASHVGSGSLHMQLLHEKKLGPESFQSSLNEEWKWEGVIAKGGTPICRARCFPVGKALDVMLPEFLDCTARTGLDMLSKHFYQAAGAWVVFFVPQSDADIVFYNEFMHYLEEKERAAVAKLDDKSTLFLVPPSDFSQNVLKVPGKLSISGVILRLEHTSSISSFHQVHEKPDSHSNVMSPSGSFPPLRSYTNFGSLGANNIFQTGSMSTPALHVSFAGSSFPQRISDSSEENVPTNLLQQPNSTLNTNSSPHLLQNSVVGTRNMTSQAPSDAMNMACQDSQVVLHCQQEMGSSHYTTGVSNIQLTGSSNPLLQNTNTSISLPIPVPTLQPQQVSKLASLLGQQRQSGSSSFTPAGENLGPLSTLNLSENAFAAAQRCAPEIDKSSSEFSMPQFRQAPLQQQIQLPQQQILNVPVPQNGQRELQAGSSAGKQQQISGPQEEVDADPQKRLQATLQLAAALLQQIQQGKGT